MITIMASESGVVSGELKRLILQNGLEQMVTIRGPEERADVDILVSLGRCPDGIRTRVLIATQGCDSPDCTSLITVGMDSRDTITPSSMLHEGGMAALQREIVTISGEIVYPREIDLTHLRGNITEKMATAAAILALGAHVQW